MSMAWEHVEAALQRVGWPDPGTLEVWRWWFRRTWGRLGEDGWFEVEDGEKMDLAAGDWAWLTLFTIRWIAEDFCAEASGDPEMYEPYWDDWLDAIRVDREVALRCVDEMSGWEKIVATLAEEYGLDQAEDEDEIESSNEEIDAAKPVQAVLLLSVTLRPALFKAMARCWGSEYRLFQSMWACCKVGDGTLELDEPEDDDSDDQPANDARATEDALLDPALADAVNVKADFALADRFDLLDEEDNARINTFGWVTSGCDVRLRGSPAYLGSEWC